MNDNIQQTAREFLAADLNDAILHLGYALRRRPETSLPESLDAKLTAARAAIEDVLVLASEATNG